MEIRFVLIPVMLLAFVTPPAAAQPGLIESLLLATQQRPWLWAVYVFTVGLPIILFVSFMWPDKRFGPPDQQYYYKKSDDVQPDDPHVSHWPESGGVKGSTDTTAARRKDARHDNQKKSDLELKDHRSV